jgi:DMSO reductase anchor subunit
LYAFRAVLGFKTSWLSREILAFVLFAFCAVIYAWKANDVLSTMNYIVFLSGFIGILCSVMVYRDTKRPFWDNDMTTAKFLMTMCILGLTTGLLISARSLGRAFCGWIIFFSFAKMLLESTVFFSLRADDSHFFKKTAILMTRPLKKITVWRFALGAAGGIVLPGLMMFNNFYALPASFFSLALLLGGELLERYLFFRAVVSLPMLARQVK